MNRLFAYTVTNETAGQTVLDFLRSHGYSHRILTQLRQTPQGLLLNGTKPFGRTILQDGDHLMVQLLEDSSSPSILPVQLPLHILYEDEDLLVVNKDADTPIHPSQGNYTNTLANAAAWYYQEKGEPFVFRCINRLDRDTTGALILAKNALSAALLSRQLQEQNIRRTYLAIVDGIPPDAGTISLPIARAEGSTILREVNEEYGEYACTHFERLDIHDGYSLLELHLDTGRTHQIRVHMKALGYPLIGDYLYNPDYSRIKRQALHSYQLSFTHPITGEPLCFTAPAPEDFVQAFLMENPARHR